MRTTQQIFDAIIEAGLYQDFRNGIGPEFIYINGELEATSSWMCMAVCLANVHGVITYEERVKVEKEINDYLSPTLCSFLRSALAQDNIPDGFYSRLAIYKNWENRPILRDLRPRKE